MKKVLFFTIIKEIKIGIFGILQVTKKSDFERVRRNITIITDLLLKQFF